MLAIYPASSPSFANFAGIAPKGTCSRAESVYWQMKFRVRDRWVYQSSGKTDRREAERQLGFKLLLAGTTGLPGNERFEQAIELLLNDARVRGLRAVDRLARAGRALLVQLEGLRAKDVTSSTLVKYAAERQGDGTRRTR
jgi:hypothetical protein